MAHAGGGGWINSCAVAWRHNELRTVGYTQLKPGQFVYSDEMPESWVKTEAETDEIAALPDDLGPFEWEQGDDKITVVYRLDPKTKRPVKVTKTVTTYRKLGSIADAVPPLLAGEVVQIHMNGRQFGDLKDLLTKTGIGDGLDRTVVS